MGLTVKNKSNIRDAFEAECTPGADSSRLALRHGFSPVCVCGYWDESQTADAVAASALGPLNPDKWWMHADEHREAAKRERLEIEKSTGKGDCRGAARAPHWPVFIGVITLLQALCTWKPCRIEPGSSPIVTVSPLPGPASKSISPSEHGPNLKSQLRSHRIDSYLLYPCPLYHYQAISVTTLVLHQPSSHPPKRASDVRDSTPCDWPPTTDFQPSYWPFSWSAKTEA